MAPIVAPSLVPFKKKVTSAADCPRTMALFLLAGRLDGKARGRKGISEKAPPCLVSISQQAAETKIEIALGTAAGAATPPNPVDKPCLKLKVYVRPTNDSLYESPEPIFTSNNSCCSFTVPDAFFVVVPVFWTILAS
ncbi:ephrin-A2 [Crotalus adamanteus]|uniref:Ephrin-A2 n=1 Tax=Crotalus adamanteus TaxID=8729 RepID=A0AAW1C675_CROAD